jgi:predicted secreted Zn-dependent protease
MNITFDVPPALIVGLIVSTILPLLVGLVTRVVTSPGIKAVILAALSAVTGLGTELLNSINSGTPYDAGTGVVLALTAFLIAVGLHYGLWKPTGASVAAQAVGSKHVAE